MKHKLFPVLFLLLFFTAIYLVPAYWTFVEKNEEITSIEEQRVLQPIPQLDLKDLDVSRDFSLVDNLTGIIEAFVSNGFQQKLQAGLSDRFPFRLFFLKASRWLDRQMIGLAYLFTNDPAFPADSQTDIEVMADRLRLIRMPTPYDGSLVERIDSALQNYADLIQKYPEVNFHVFYIQEVWDSEFHPLSPYFKNADNGRSIRYFEQNMPQGLSLGKYTFTSFEDMRWLFKTDHHWTIRGACRGYGMMYPLLAANYPQITPKVDCDQYMVVPGVKFRGSSARNALYPMQPEEIEVSIAQLPEHKILVDGKESKYIHLEGYLKGNYSTEPYFDHYRMLFGSFNKRVEYIFPGSPDRSLLILGSSYRTPVQPFIASHYRHTYVIDLRFEEGFSLGAFLQEHPVQDVLILGEDNVVYQFDEWKIKP